MQDFEATCVASDTIRVDIYDDDIEGETRGRYTKIVSLCDAMSMVICLTQTINKCEVLDAARSKKK